MNRYLAKLQWTPPSVDLEEEEQEIVVHGGNPRTVRLGLEQKIARIEKVTGWACDLTVTPVMTLCPKK